MKEEKIVSVLDYLHKRILKSRFAEQVTEGEILALTEVKDLIKRKNAEIETLKKRINRQKHALFEQQVYTAKLQNEIERLKSWLDSLKEEEKYSIIKCTAYKVFAEELKTSCKNLAELDWNQKSVPVSWSHAYTTFIYDINNLLKEMIGTKEWQYKKQYHEFKLPQNQNVEQSHILNRFMRQE